MCDFSLVQSASILILFGSGKASPQGSYCRAFQCTASQRYQSERICPRCNVGEVEDELHGFCFRCMTVQFWENFIGSRNVHMERDVEVFPFR